MVANTEREREREAAAMKKPSISMRDSAHPESPLRLHSPHHSDQVGDPPESPPYASPSTAWPENPSHADKHTQCSPALYSLPSSWNTNSKGPAAAGTVPPVNVKERLPSGHEKRPAPASTKRVVVKTLQKVALWFRVVQVVACMISFSVMAADKAKGWSGDSYDRYIEYRYCLVVNAIAFVYSVLQACDLGCRMIGREDADIQTYHAHLDFLMDQVLAYLLISASSSGATRLYDWQLNWGRDKFTEMASVSIITSFIGFIAFAITSIISALFVFTSHHI